MRKLKLLLVGIVSFTRRRIRVKIGLMREGLALTLVSMSILVSCEHILGIESKYLANLLAGFRIVSRT